VTPPVIAGLLLAALLAMVLGVRELAEGNAQNRAVSVRTALDDVEARAARLDVRADVALQRTRLGAYLADRLATAGVPMLTSTALALLLGAGLALTLVIDSLLSRILAPLGFVAAAFLANMYLQRRQGERKELFIAQLPQLARVLSNAASAGLALRSAIGLAADDLAEPARTELRRVSDAMAVGQSLEDALRDLERRLPARELSVLVSTLVISARAGGSLVEALRNIATTLEQRKELRREVRTVLSQSVYTGYLVVALGLGILLLLNTLQPGLLDIMLSKPIGQVAIFVSFGLFGAGLLLIKRITRIDV
jgi:tight adherence protein B